MVLLRVYSIESQLLNLRSFLAAVAMHKMAASLVVALATFGVVVYAQGKVTQFESPTVSRFLPSKAGHRIAESVSRKCFQDCGNQETNWKPCIDRKIGDQVFASCCERFVPPECRGMCTYETHAIEARVIVGLVCILNIRSKICFAFSLCRQFNRRDAASSNI